MNDTREGEGVTRELATGSITSSRVMELMSNQASETFHAVSIANWRPINTAVHEVVKSHVYLVQSVVHEISVEVTAVVVAPVAVSC